MEFPLIFLVCLVATASAQTMEMGTTQAPEETVTVSVCGQTSFTDSHGIITSLNYPGNYDNDLYCDYYVYAPTEGLSSFSFIFTSFHVDTPDFLTISCSDSSEVSLHEYSGHAIPYPASIPSCRQARLSFRSDYTNVSSGFSIDYYVSDGGCGNTLFTGSTGFVISPHWPEFYRYNENCTNIIWAPEQTRIKIYFHFFNLESNCSSDWLEISCLDNTDFGVQRFCGNYNFHNFSITECSQVLLSFHSDDANNYQGFNIEYTIYQNGGCGNTAFFDPSGVITSPNYPGNYTNYLYCQYNTYSSLGSGVLFFFTSFKLQEEDKDFVVVRCVSNNYFEHLYSGNNHPSPILFANCSQGAIELHTDHNIVFSGFSADYYVSEGGCGNTLYTSSSGYVTSPNWPSNYGFNQNCSNIIHTDDRSTFYLNIQSFILQNCCGCDWLEISCLDNSDYGPNRYCGQYDPVDIYIYNCSDVLLWFHSDESGNDQGFNIEYNVYTDAGDGKAPSNRKPNAEETKLNNGIYGKQNAEESVPRDVKSSAAENAPTYGRRNAAESDASRRQSNGRENTPSD